MKKLFTCLLFAFPALSLSAQSFEHALSFGYNTIPTVMCPLTDGRFMVAGRGEPAVGALFIDTLYAVIFDASGQIDNRIILPAPINEVHFIFDAVPTPDGGFVVSITASNCDAGSGASALLCYDASGALRWNLLANPDEGIYLPDHLETTPDGAPLGLTGHQLTAYDYLTGSVLWQTTLAGQSSIYDLDFIPGSWDFAAVGYPDLQIWRQTGPPDQHNYYQDYAENLPTQAFLSKVLATSEGLFTFNKYNNELIRFDEAGQTGIFSPFYPPINDFITTDSGFWLLGRGANSNWLLNISPEGQALDTVLLGDTWRLASQVIAKEDVLTVVGVNGSGPGSNPGSSFYSFDATHLWLQSVSVSAPANPSNNHNASLTAVEQGFPVDVSIGSMPPLFNTLYSLSGGDFKVQVTNTGDSVLEQVDVMIHFGWDEFGVFCYTKPALRSHFEALALAPGESAWLNIGDLYVPGQDQFPTQYCFWTAAPNGRPDADHSDDAFCHTISTEAGEPAAGGQPRIFPNPAPAGELVVEWPTPLTETIDYQIFDALGRKVGRGRADAGTSLTQVSTRDWAPGFYFFQAGKWRGKVVVSKDF